MPRTPSRGDSPADKTTYTRLNAADYAAVEARSKAAGRTVSQTLRWALVQTGMLDPE
jgi:hypothetical protein